MEKYFSENGLKDLLEDNNAAEDMLYPIIHLKGPDIEVAITHSKTQYSEEYHSFVNGQHTTQGEPIKLLLERLLLERLKIFTERTTRQQILENPLFLLFL